MSEIQKQFVIRHTLDVSYAIVGAIRDIYDI